MVKPKPTAPYLNANRQRVSKGWGFEEWIANYEGSYCLKLLQFYEGRRCSFHYHAKKDETYYVAVGKGTLRFIEPEKLKDAEQIIAKKEYHLVTLCAGDSFHIPPGMAHQFVAQMNTTVYEGSTTHYESDVIRIVKGD